MNSTSPPPLKPLVFGLALSLILVVVLSLRINWLWGRIQMIKCWLWCSGRLQAILRDKFAP